MPNLSAHDSRAFPPLYSPRPQSPAQSPPSKASNFDLGHERFPPLITPAFTPPSTPGSGTPSFTRNAQSIPTRAIDTRHGEPPRLLETLPEVNCIVRARIPTTAGHEMFLHLYQNNIDNKEHMAIVFGPYIRSKSLDAPRPGETEMDRMIRGAYTGRLYPGRTTSRLEQIRQDAGVSPLLRSSSPPVASPASSSDSLPLPTAPLVRIHSECYTGETVWSARCDCGEQLDEAGRLISSSPTGGAIVYLRQEGRGIGLGEKLKAYNLQDLGSDTYEANVLLRHPADARSYGLATSILVDLGLGVDGGEDGRGLGRGGIRLLTNNPDKVRAVEGPNREVIVKERVGMVPIAWKTGGKAGIMSEELEKYLGTKIEKFNHDISA